MVTRKNRLTTDAFREIKNTLNRYVSILVLAALAVAFLSGLRSAAPDMQYTADNYYDRTSLMDGYVLSTLGLTEEDLDALAAAAGIEAVEGCRDLDATAIDRIVNLRSMPERLNLLEVVEGRLPEAPDECVTEHLLLVKLGLQVGDKLEVTLTEDHEGDLENTAYTIVGVVNSPLYVGLERGNSSLGSGSVDAFVYVPRENFTFDYYTCAYFTGQGLAALDSYGDEYEEKIDALVDSLDGLADQRAQIRHDTLIGDAQAELDDARREFEDAKADADKELADAWQELQDGRKELDDGWADYYDGEETYAREIADAERKLRDALADLRQGEIDLADGRQEYEDGLAEYQDGLKKYEDGWAEYQDGLAEYEDGKAKYEDALKEYEDGKAKYEDGLKEYEDGLAQYNSGLASYRSGQAKYDGGLKEYQENKKNLDMQKAQLDNGWKQYNDQLDALAEEMGHEAAEAALAGLKAELDKNQALLDGGYAALEQGKAELDAGAAQLSGARSQLNAAQRELDEAKKELDEAKAELEEGEQELADAKAELDDAEQELADAKKELDDAKTELDDAWAKLEDARAELEQGEIDLRDGWAEYNKGVADLRQARVDGRQELDDALAELNDGEREYADGLREYEDGKAEADEEIADAQKKLDDAQEELDDVEECEWYVLSRFTNAGIVGYSQDSDRVGNLANVFPVIFFLVAALACLTTMTRMVEEQRTQIGSLKALGFSRLAIAKKYIGYAFSASLVGGILGLGLGCTLIPLVIANAFNIMYAIPALEFKPQVGLYVWAVLAAVACTTGAALWACLSTLIATPANLMRPRAPKAGRRVFLERIRPIWKRLTFTWKVTMRNLFRYQRRFWMTVIGIGGCTALIVTGFGLHESIFSILNEQFDHVFLYDATVGLDKDAGAQKLGSVERYLTDSPWVEDYLITSETMLEASSSGPAQNVYLFAVDDLERFNEFIQLGHRLDDGSVTLPDGGVVITEKLSELLGVSVGDTITLDGDKRVDAVVADIAENYVSHYVYLSNTCYQELFGEEPEQNVMLLRYADGAGEEESDTVSSQLMAMDGVDSYSYIATLRDNFTDSMEAIDYAVVIIIVAAAALAFVVLYNLTNINITERVRELATLKVLGFYDREVTAYVYRENLFLTLFGIVLGLVMGRFLHAWMVLTVEVDIVMFGRAAPPYAYVLAAVLTVVFSVAVNIAAHFKLKKVDMVESLKTVE
ncbi:MAG: FtsX-like permease family protein [Oscillospiraceae bacterium]|nr:FtsX-like permease family protein [Oscillospiraceae bacterium]